jgi:glycolate oxidase FAD binding subunit
MPDTTEQLGAVLRDCAEARATVIPWGGGTAMALGNPPREADIVIKLTKLSRLIEHDPANLTVSAQCGITLAALQSALVAERQFVPIDAAFPERTTIGGIVAANLNGPRRSSYGSVRDLVIGMKVTLANGESIKAGGKVVKNVAGYDLCKLFVGSLGTLGIVTEATLRVAPIAESTATFIGRATRKHAQSFIDELFRSPMLPSAVFVLGENLPDDWRVAVWCEGFAEAVERHIRDLEAIAAGVNLHAEVMREENHGELWKKVGDFPLAPHGVVYRVTVPRAAFFHFLEQARRWNVANIVGDVSVGTIWLAFAADRTAIARFAEIESAARQERGHAVVFSAPAALKSAMNVWGSSPDTVSLMREIKRQFDPDELLNPGRFLAGI